VPLTFAPDCQAAIDLAKRALADGAPLDARVLLAALYQQEAVARAHPGLDACLPPLVARRPEAQEKVGLAPDLQPVFQKLAATGTPISAATLFDALVESEAGRSALCDLGAPADVIAGLAGKSGGSAGPPPPPPPPPPGHWRTSDARRKAREALDSFGRMLTLGDLPPGSVVEREDSLRALVRTLSKMRRRNAIVLGPAGTGKSALVYELARRMARGDASLPPRLREMDIFELSPTFLRSGASVVGQYEERMKGLLGVLKTSPQIILFVDEIHSLLQSGVHDRGPFTDANESLKAALGRGEVTCLGCTTPGEYRRYIEPDEALRRRFGIIRLDPPSPEVTVGILKRRREAMESYYAPLRIPEAVLARTVALTEEYGTGRNQPDKSIQLLDEACAHCVTAEPPLPEVTEEVLLRALEDMVGHGIAHRERLTETAVLAALRARIVGQDAALEEIAHAFVAGFGDWSRRSGPRGVMLFGGPTGTGKTETALILASLLGEGERNLIRVDCNTLQGSAHDAGPAIARLLGVPPGYVGYARGQGGILSRIRDVPECVLLFHEF